MLCRSDHLWSRAVEYDQRWACTPKHVITTSTGVNSGNSTPSCKPTATQTGSLSRGSPHAAMGKAWSQSPLCGAVVAGCLAPWMGSASHLRIVLYSASMTALSQACCLAAAGPIDGSFGILPNSDVRQWSNASSWPCQSGEKCDLQDHVCPQRKSRRPKVLAMTLVWSPEYQRRLEDIVVASSWLQNIFELRRELMTIAVCRTWSMH